MPRPTRPDAKTITIRTDVPPSLYSRVKKVADAEKRTTGRQVEILLERAVTDYEKRSRLGLS